jgi:hypothetical protein
LSFQSQFYQNQGWKSWGDWLGTKQIATFLRKYRPFEEAQIFVHTLNLENHSEWKAYCKSGKKPDDIPANPYNAYNNKGWKGMGDWLGNKFR